MRFRVGMLSVLLFTASASSVLAQAPAVKPETGWTHGTTLGASIGLATDSSATGVVAGTLMGWEFTPTVSIEGTAFWLDRGSSNNAFAAALTTNVGLTHTHPVVPFASAGFGMYRFTTGPNATHVPAFYRDRIEQTPDALTVGHTFTDPAFTVGMGVNLSLSRHVGVRPEVRGLFPFTGSDVHAVPTFRVDVVYHFEDHTVTR